MATAKLNGRTQLVSSQSAPQDEHGHNK